MIPPGFENEQNPRASLLLDQVRTHGIPVRTIAAPSTWNQGSTQFTVLHPPPDWHPETPDNARSLVLDVAHGGRHLLLTGDLDQLGLVELVAQAQPEPIDLMLAPHHGGKSANPSWLYSWARPRAVVVSQRPSESGTTDALTPLKRGGIPLLRTWERGAIHFRWSFDRILTQGFLDRDDRPPVPLTGLGANRTDTHYARSRPRRIDINSASQEDLMALPVIGPTIARRIIEGRPYRMKVEDMVKVFGAKLLWPRNTILKDKL